MSNLIDLLLGAGDKVLDRPTGEYELKRLSALCGEPFIISLRALTMREFNELPLGDDFRVHVVLKSVTEPDFRDSRLLAKYTPEGRKTPLTPIELLNKMLLPGEITTLAAKIEDLSGFGKNAIEEIKKN